MRTSKITKQEVLDWFKNPDIITGQMLLQKVKPTIRVNNIQTIAAKLAYYAKMSIPREIKQFKKSSTVEKINTIHPDIIPDKKPTAVSKPLKSKEGEETEKKTYYPTPPIIEQIVKEHAKLVALRAQLDKQRKELGTSNNATTIKKRKILTQSINQHSTKIEILWQAKENYYEKNIMPDSQLLQLPNPQLDVDNSQAISELKKELNALRAAYRRDGYQLEYQSHKKESESNPMPKTKKRFSIENRMKKRLEKIDEIKEKIKQLAT